MDFDAAMAALHNNDSGNANMQQPDALPAAGVERMEMYHGEEGAGTPAGERLPPMSGEGAEAAKKKKPAKQFKK